MTVASTDVVSAWVQGNGSNKNWSYSFKILAAGDAYIEYKNGVAGAIISTQVDTNFVPDSDFVGGYVQYPVAGAALSSSYYVRVRRRVALSQDVEIGNEGSFRPEIHERAIDRLCMMGQQIAKDLADLTVDTDSAAASAAAAALSAASADADATQTAADRVQTGLDRVAVAADKVTVAADKAIVAADKATVAADKAIVIADKGTVAADKLIVAGYRDEVEADRVDVQADKVIASSAADVAVAAQIAAEAALASTLAAYDSFDDRYLGSKAADPTLDNDGNALAAGMLYFNSVSGAMMVYTGTLWVAAYVSGSGYLAAASNLSDLASPATARTNLDVYSKAVIDGFAAAAAAKTTPIDADSVAIVDSAAANVQKRVTFANLWVWIQAKLNGTAKATPVMADRLYIGDSAASNAQKYSTLTQIMATLAGTAWTMSGAGKITTILSAVGGAGFNLPHGAAPTIPTNGDLWSTTAGLFARINGTTRRYLQDNEASAYGLTLMDDADAATARTTLGVGSMATRAVTISTSDPSGGADGDVWLKYTP